MAAFIRGPDLAAWKTQEDRNEEKNDVKDSVHRNKTLGKPIKYVSLHGAKYAEYEQHDREFCEE